MNKLISAAVVGIVSGLGYLAIGPRTAVAIIVIYVVLVGLARLVADVMARKSHGGM